MVQQTIKYGAKELAGSFVGKVFNDLPEILATAYDVEVPSTVEFYVNGTFTEGDTLVQESDTVIEIRAVPGRKGC